HGSHCAGVIAAEHNGEGVAGMAQSNVKVMGVKWLNSGGGGYISDAIAAIDYAAWFNVKITSNSWGGNMRKKDSRALETAIADSGALFVASAGNSGSSKAKLPAGYDLDNIVSVAATTHRDALVSWSNYGTSWVDLGAPGVNIMSCGKGGRYLWMSGTSMSCPHVAGAAAMILSADNTKTVAELKAAILDNVEPEESLAGMVGTGGKLNMANIFGETEITDDGSSPQQVSDLSSSATTMSSVTLDWTAMGGNSDGTQTNYIYDIRYHTGDITTFDWDTANTMYFEPAPKAPGTTESYEVEHLSGDTKYNFAILAIDEGGRAGIPCDYVTATTDTPIWDVQDVVTTEGNIYYHSMALDDSGNAAFVYSKEQITNFVHYSGGSWVTETIESGRGTGGGVDLTWDGSTWWVVMGGNACRVAERTGTDSWSITTVEPRKVGFDWKTIESYGQIIGVSYRAGGKNGGVKYAEYDGSSWTIEQVEAGAAARYNDLEYDSDGNPGIAYSDVIDDNWLRVLSYAHKSSGTWTVQTVLSGTIGFGVQVDLEFDAYDNPHMVCCGDELMYAYWDGSAWQDDAVDSYTYSGEPSLAMVSGTPYVSYIGEYGINVAKLVDTTWVTEALETERGSGFRTCLEYDG
ncbi:MAG: S8 family serine peptidase, partial [Thermoplasmata archaeon]|nr:S8 family serine peptidase [Thermoplasmata archaeon]